MGQPYLQADPPTSLPDDESLTMGFETLSCIIQNSVSQFVSLPPPTLRALSVGVMLSIAENGWEFHHDDWPGFTHEECDDDEPIQAPGDI